MKLLVVDDHALVREGLLLTLRKLGRHVVLLQASDAESTMLALEYEPDVDLVLLDLLLPGVNGLSLLSSMRKRYPTVPVVMVSGVDDPATVQRAIEAGASGFVPKSSHSDVFLDAVRCVLEGGVYVPESTPAPAPSAPRRRPKSVDEHLERIGLSIAQRRVFDLLVQGCSNRQIGVVLGLAEGTVKVHVSRIFKALGVTSRAQALVVAARLGLRL